MFFLWVLHFLLFYAMPFLLGLAAGLIWPYLPGMAGVRRVWLAPAAAVLIAAVGIALAAITGITFESGMINPFLRPASFVSRVGILMDIFVPRSLAVLLLGSVIGLGYAWARVWLFHKLHEGPK